MILQLVWFKDIFVSRMLEKFEIDKWNWHSMDFYCPRVCDVKKHTNSVTVLSMLFS